MVSAGIPSRYPARRRWPRFRVTVPTVVELLTTGPGFGTAIAGSTRDVGAGGVYVVSQERVEPGTRVRARVELGRLGPGFSRTGSVVRREEYGFAVQFDEAAAEVLDLSAAAR